MTSGTHTVTAELLELGHAHAAHNYDPLPVVVAQAEGSWVTDAEGRRYLPMLAAYSALNFGHRHPRLVAAARRQLERVTLVSRAFDHDQFGPFCAELAELAGMDAVLPMNTGAEAVETAIKVARKWGYDVKGVPPGQAVIIAMLRTGEYQARAVRLGERMHARLAALPAAVVREVRGRGLWAGVSFASLDGREACERLAAHGVLAKETHGATIRLAPPLVIGEEDLDWGLDRIEEALR